MINLHVHTSYSILDSNAKMEDLVERAKELGQTAIAQTDHAYIIEAPEFAKQCDKAGIKYIYGCEVYECDNRFEKDKDNKYFHLILLAMNEIGRINLNTLVTLADKEGFYYKARCDWDLLKKHNEGLICMSACLGSRLDRKLAEETDTSYDEAKEIALKFKDIFGDRYYIEFQSHRDNFQIKINKKLISLAKELEIPFVVTADTHFVKEEDRFFHDEIFVKIAKDSDASEYYTDCFLQSDEDVRQFCKDYISEEDINTAINNTHIIADRCNVQIPFSTIQIPNVNIPDWFGGDYFDYFKYLCNKGFEEKGLQNKANSQEYIDRMNFEIGVLHELEYDRYLLYVVDKVKVINEYSELGDGRGSVSSSLCAWLLGITRIDPLVYGCFFERFADMTDLERPKDKRHVADCDLDLCQSTRGVVLDKIVEQDGEDNVVSIMAVQYMWAKSSIKDIGRILGIPFEITNEITKGITSQELTEDVLNEEVDRQYIERYPTLFQYAKKLAGLPRNISVHASGKITTIKEAVYYAPVRYLDGVAVIQCTMDTVELIGLMKFDLLGLRTRDIIKEARDLAGLPKDALNPEKMNLFDKKVFKLFEQGRTDEVFQFSADFVKGIINKVKISSILDLAIITSLARPGAMSMIDTFIKRKNGEEKIEYLHPDLEPILKNTYGILIFQESVLSIGKIAGMKYPDTLRKAVGKKKPELLQQSKPELYQGLLRRGWTGLQIDTLWDQLLDFGRYGFALPHAVAYATTSYESAFLKVYYPLQFWTAVLNSHEGNSEKVISSLSSMVNDGIKVSVPNYKNINDICFVQDGKIFIGTNIIKGLSARIAHEAEWIKKINVTKDNFVDLLIYNEENAETKIGKTTMTILAKVGFFDNVAKREWLIDIIDQFNNGKGLKYSAKLTDKTKAARLNALREYAKSSSPEQARIRDILGWETDYFGVPLSKFVGMPSDYAYIMSIEKSKYTTRDGGASYIFMTYGIADGKVRKLMYNKNTTVFEGGIIQLKKIVEKSAAGKPYKTPVLYEYKKLT